MGQAKDVARQARRRPQELGRVSLLNVSGKALAAGLVRLEPGLPILKIRRHLTFYNPCVDDSKNCMTNVELCEFGALMPMPKSGRPESYGLVD